MLVEKSLTRNRLSSAKPNHRFAKIRSAHPAHHSGIQK